MYKITSIALSLLLIGVTGYSQEGTEKLDSLSYALGMYQASDLQNKGFDSLDTDSYIKGFSQSLEGGETMMDMQSASALIKAFLQDQKMREEKALLEAGQEFLKANAQREEVKVTESGLQYEVLVEGTGQVPTATDKVVTHYTGKLIDGTVFDSSVERGEPISFPVGGVIQGWQEALQMMPVGSKWMLYIPYDLAYGPRGAGGGVIPPYATLIFEIELIEIQ